MMPYIGDVCFQTNVSLQRIQKFVNNPELDPGCVERHDVGSKYFVYAPVKKYILFGRI